jgi:hypothetical protein
MALVFNPFTGNFDNVMASSSDMSFSGGSLNVNGDLTLDSGGTFTTTVQAVTPTANRTISFPDQTGTVGLVSGATGNIQYNNAGQLAGTGDLNAELDWTSASGTYTGLKVNIDNGAGGAPLGSGNLLDLQSNGSSKCSVNSAGDFTAAGVTLAGTAFAARTNTGSVGLYSSGSFGFSSVGGVTSSTLTLDTVLRRDAANTFAQRNGTAAQTYRLYNTYTDASNYERLSTTWDTNVCYTKPENLGTGSARIYVPVTGATTVGGLPAANVAGAGARAFVTDANSTTFLDAAVGGGANSVPVVSDGTSWLIG